MVECKHCGETFDDALSLGRHIRHKHHKQKEEPGDTKKVICPVCDFVIPGGWGPDSMDLTVCERCLCFFNSRTGELEKPPPEKCVAELAGLPCPNPQHKVYYRRYVESEQAQRTL